MLRGICLAALLVMGPLVAHAQVDTLEIGRSPVGTTPRAPLSPLGNPFPYDAYRHHVIFDTASDKVYLYEQVFGESIGQPRTLTLDEFITQRQKEQERAMWEKHTSEYALGQPPAAPKTELEKIFGSGGEFKLPVPQNPIFSIFGPPTISINVNAAVNVSAGWQWDNNNLTSISSLGSTQSAPFFNQNITVAASGKIGDKLKLSADFDNGRSFDFDNQLKIAFGGGPGTDDDIIQSVEAGNVQLQSPSTLIGGSQALFGVKSSFKFGPLFLTTIASQKRGEKKTMTISGGSVKSQIAIKPYEYAQNHFFLDTVYKRFYDDYFASTPPTTVLEMEPYNVQDLEVYEQVKDASIPGQFQAIAWADLEAVPSNTRYAQQWREQPRDTQLPAGTVQRGSFKKLELGTGYEYDRQLGTLTIRSLQQDKLYAVAYRIKNGLSFGEMSNTRDSNSVAVLKLVYMSNLQPNFTTLWARQMKNIYPLQGVRNVDLQNSTIRINFGVPPDTSEVLRVAGSPRLVTVLGVDRYNSSNEAQPDGEFDIRSPYFFDPTRGEIIFPSTEPFRKGLRQSVLGANAEPYVLDAIYDRTREEARRDTKTSQYTITGEIAGAGGAKIQLPGYQLAPGSVRVSINGEPLREGEDYRVDPVFGEVTLLSARALSTTGNVVVDYEQNDFFTTAVKTLLGLRADYDLFNKRYGKSRLGMTFLRYAQNTQTEKVQIYSGDEPTTNMMLGFDGSLDYQASFITKAIDALPLIDTKEPSTINLRGEWAMVMPNPNTKPSLVASDGDIGAAYVDDFESGAKRQIQLSTSYTYWHPSSPPQEPLIGEGDSARAAHKGHFYWFNRLPANTPTQEIWENRDVAQGAQKTTVLDLVFDPEQRGMYNPNLGYEQGNVSRDSVWGGMMRSLSFYSTNLDEENIDYIEITMKVDGPLDPNAKMYIDLGQISEDVIPNIALNTEDGITANNPQQDDILNEGEDVGIDGLADENEPGYSPADTDPARDNYASYSEVGNGDPNDYRNYRKVNGVERNVGRESGPFPDTEDLNGNRGLDLDNTYFSYEVDLNPNALTNQQIVGGGNNGSGWRQYRIPIRTGFKTVGNPSFSNVQFARVWFKSPTLLRVRIAEINLVGSDWRNLDSPSDSSRDPKLDIAFVSVVENSGPPDYYTIPPGVSQEREYNDPDVLKNEQSLSIRVRDLERGESRGAVRIRPRAFDVFNYKQMKFFLHGGGDMDDAVTPGQEPKVVAFMRFGWDSLNYYEYRVPLLRGWNEYTIDFADLAAIKDPDAGVTDGTGRRTIPVPGQPGNKFVLRGIPSLTRIQFIAFGVENNAYPGALATTMWVNELRAVGAEDANDWAATVSAGVKLADLGNVNFNAKRINPNFHQLEERFGQRIEQTDWAVNSVFQLEKFLPNSFKGSTIPLTINHVERVELPRYVSESDVEVGAAIRQILERPGQTAEEAVRKADSLRIATQTVVVHDGFAFSGFRLVFPGENWIIRDILNRLTLGFTYDQTRQRSPLIEQRFGWNWDFQGRYAVDIPQNFDLQPFQRLFDGVPVLSFWKDFRVNFLPSQFAANTSVHRERTTEQLRNIPDPSPVVRDFRATRGAQFNWRMTEGGLLNVTTDYSVDTRSSLTHLETDAFGRQRTGGEITKDLFFKEGRLFNFGLDNDLSQNITFNTRPRIPFIPNIDRFVTPTARYNVRYSWQDQLGTTNRPGGYTKSAQWTSNSTLGLDVRLAALGNALFGDGGRGAADSTSESALTTLLRYLIKIPILDFQTVRFSYTQNNTAKNPGVVGSTGLSNLWGRSLLFRSESPDFGPGTAYQLGLISDPHGKLIFGLQPSFPFIKVDTRQGIRAPSIYVQDNYTQKNTLTATTNRPLWPGASLDLNWSVDWGYNKNYSVTSNANGVVTGYSGAILTGNLTRTYLSLPSFFGINIFNNDIEDVVEEYRRRVDALPKPGGGDAEQITYNKQLTEVLSETFEEQLETLNWLPGSISRYLPRMNWRLQWNGIEKLPFFSGWAQSVSFRHEYKSQFVRNFTITDDEGLKPETHTVSRGFQPFAQITITGKPDVWKGTMTGSIAFKTQTNFSLISSARSEISQELKNEIEAQFGYQRRGLSLPFFGLNLKNDVEFTFAFSYAKSTRKRFDLTNFTPAGNNDGSTRINIRPAIRYTLSNTVQASAFISHEATIPDSEGSREIRRSTTKVGIDLRIGISGGR